MELIAKLRQNPYLGGLDSALLSSLADSSIVTTYQPGQRIFAEGEHAHGVHFVVDGEVEVSRVIGGRVHRVTTLEPGSLFGVMALLEGSPRSATCTAIAPTTLAMIPKEVVGLLLNQSAPIAYAFQRALAAQMARDLRHNDARLRDLLARATK